MKDESNQTYIELEKIPEAREIERINNRLVQKIEEIKRLQAGLDVNVANLKALAIKELELEKTLIIDGRKFSGSAITNIVLKQYMDWSSVKSVVVSKGGKD
jgi:hypothetical protein